MADRNIAYSDLWKIYRESDRYKEHIIHWLDLKKNLPNMSWVIQLEVLDNAPEDIIKKHKKQLKPEALRKLGLEKKPAKQGKVKQRNWEILC